MNGLGFRVWVCLEMVGIGKESKWVCVNGIWGVPWKVDNRESEDLE